MTDPHPSVRDLLRGLPVLRHPAPAFDPAAAPEDPAALFETWLGIAVESGVVEPHAMTLSTVDESGQPDARVLILKDLRGGAWWFATDTTTAKAAQLGGTPAAALTFYWPTIGRQVRLRGQVRPGTAEENGADFLTRTPSARAVVLAAQTCPAGAGRDAFVAAVREAEETIAEQPDLVSPAWVTYGLVPTAVEFWQADPGRLHHRLVYTRRGEGWTHAVAAH